MSTKTKLNIKDILDKQKPFKRYEDEDLKEKKIENTEKIKKNKKTKQISLYLYQEEIKLLDELVRLHAGTRSSYLRKYILEKAREANLF